MTDRNIATIYGDYISAETGQLNPPVNEMVKIGLWLELDIGIGFLVGLGVGSLIGQRTVSTVLMIVLQIIVTPILAAHVIPYFLNGQRVVVGIAMDQLRPAGLAGGARRPGRPGPRAVRRARGPQHPADAHLGDDHRDRGLDRRLVGDRRLADGHPRRLTARDAWPPVTPGRP